MLTTPQLLRKVRAFLRASYPAGLPATGHVPLAALLPRRLSVDELSIAATELAVRGRHPVDGTSIGLEITRHTNELPSPQDIERVTQRLQALGWPDDHQARLVGLKPGQTSGESCRPARHPSSAACAGSAMSRPAHLVSIASIATFWRRRFKTPQPRTSRQWASVAG